MPAQKSNLLVVDDDIQIFSGDGIPPGVAADASYEKGTSLPSLLQIVAVMTQPKPQASLQRSATSAPIWVPTNGHDPSGEAYVMIACPECLRTFPQVLGRADCVIHEAGCHFCHGLIHYAIVKRADPASPRTLQQNPGGGMPTDLSAAS